MATGRFKRAEAAAATGPRNQFQSKTTSRAVRVTSSAVIAARL